MRNVALQLNRDEYHDFVDHLQELGFERIILGVPGPRFMTKLRLLRQYGTGMLRLTKRLQLLRDIETLVVFGRFAFAVKLLARLRLLRYRRLICFGFFVHGPAWFPLFRCLACLDNQNDHYVVFSRSEVDLYQSRLGIRRESMHFVPLGDWGQLRQPREEEIGPENGRYYLAAGRSNRRYRALVEAFRSIPEQLVIICSRSNCEELQGVDIPSNISILRDVSVAVFDDYVRGAKAGIISLEYDTGASGQSLALSLMRNSKCVIASDSGPLRGYVEHGVSGYLLANVEEELPLVIQRIEEGGLASSLGRAARERYERMFSRAAAAAAFDRVLHTSA
ncbi:MAG TPA: hypothetical protein VEG68_18860 [Terriglobales bacterium]|nr:hypothetical protein [Terriglobales bacterium]